MDLETIVIGVFSGLAVFGLTVLGVAFLCHVYQRYAAHHLKPLWARLLRQLADLDRDTRLYRSNLPTGRGDITAYRSTIDIYRSGRFTAGERQAEYRRRGKSPSGVIDGVYNDMYLEAGRSYSDMERDRDAGA